VFVFCLFIYIYICMIYIYMIWYDMIWYDVIWYDMIWYDVIWYDMIYVCMLWIISIYIFILYMYVQVRYFERIWTDYTSNLHHGDTGQLTHSSLQPICQSRLLGARMWTEMQFSCCNCRMWPFQCGLIPPGKWPLKNRENDDKPW
jgi:hypothetical protein